MSSGQRDNYVTFSHSNTITEKKDTWKTFKHKVSQKFPWFDSTSWFYSYLSDWSSLTLRENTKQWDFLFEKGLPGRSSWQME